MKWELVRDAKGRPVGHHITYELKLHDGRVLRTRVSRPANKTTYGPGLWKAILSKQLDVTEVEFWAGVKHRHRHRQRPERGQPQVDTAEATLPAGLVHQLIHVARVPEDEVKKLTLEQAVAVMAEHWSTPAQG